MAKSVAVESGAHRRNRAVADDTCHRQSHEEMLKRHQFFQIDGQHAEEDGVADASEEDGQIECLDVESRVDEEIHHYGIIYHRSHAYREQSGIFLMEHLAPEQAEEASGDGPHQFYEVEHIGGKRAEMKSLVEKAGLQDEFEIDSAGIGGWHIGQLPDSRMRKCGAKHGYNFNSHARQFQKSDFARFETIVVMDNENYRAITSMASSESDRKKVVRMADFLTHHREYTTVPDPYYGDYSDFELVITLLEDACQELLDSIIGEG
jgi:protein-tyrosine phosphatase